MKRDAYRIYLSDFLIEKTYIFIIYMYTIKFTNIRTLQIWICVDVHIINACLCMYA